MRRSRYTRELAKPFLAAAADLPDPLAWRTEQGRFAAFTRPRSSREGPNEDAYALYPIASGHVLVVADGVGGSQQAEEAAGLILQELETKLALDDPQTDAFRSLVLDGLETANQRLLDEYRDAAATVVVAIIAEGRVRIVHVGDCAALVFGQRGKLKYQTVSHSPVGFAQEAGLMGEQEAIEHEDRHLISNAVGARDMRIEVGPWLDLAPHDRLLLASDGVFGNLLLDEIVSICRKGDIRKALCSLARLCQRRMEEPEEGDPSKPDDATAILFGLARG